MTYAELEAVDNFKIWNQHGSIEFIGKVDLTYCNLPKIIDILPKNIDVYPDETDKPPRGKKLNVPAILCFFGGVKPKPGELPQKKEAKLRKRLDKKGAEHISYDYSSFKWTFKVPGF